MSDVKKFIVDTRTRELIVVQECPKNPIRFIRRDFTFYHLIIEHIGIYC